MNIEFKNGNILITVPYNEGKGYPKSTSGKSRVVASSNGFAAIPGAPDNVKVNLNVIEIIAKGDR